ncbi:MAG: 5,10-methylenetetrahydromethanopterin reductase [Acidimicrobiaceae bacterium]|nr:5,10-methylenetetrahydromethanopterin reductase [Acidimicrobiaceae bacterium]
MSGPRSGVALQAIDPPQTFVEMVEEIEQLGYDHLWLTDSSLHARNCYAALTLAALHSRTLTLGTAVTNPLTRHPALTAAAVATIDEIAEGRAVLGIGAGDRPLLALGLAPSPLDELEAAIGAIRQLWRGEHVDMKSDSFSLQGAHMRFAAREVPVFISASGPRTLELSGRVADGVILLVGLFPEAVAWALEHVRIGAEKAGRSDVPHVAVFAYGAIDEDRQAALNEARSIAAWFPQTAPVICELAGLSSALVADVRKAYAGGEFQEAAAAAALLPDDFVRRVALAGDRADARASIEAVLAAGADSVHVFPLGSARMATVRAFAGCFRDVVGRS